MRRRVWEVSPKADVAGKVFHILDHFFSSFKGEAQQLIGGSQQITSGGACEPYIASEPFALALEPCTVQVLLTQTNTDQGQ